MIARGLFAGLLALLPMGTAWAAIEVATAPDTPMVRHMDGREPTVVVVEPPSHPLPYPGGCFNCSSTQRSNQDNVSRSLGRAHAFSQNLYRKDQPRTLLIIP